MIDFTRFKGSTDEEATKVRRNRDRTLENIRRKKTRELERLAKDYDSRAQEQEREFNRELQGINEGYYRLASSEILAKLQEDYETLRARSQIGTFSEKDLEKARRIKEKAERMKDPAVIELLKEVLNEAELTALESLSKDFTAKKEITSYIAATPEGVYLLIPSKGEDNGLVKGLENQVDEIITRKSLDMRPMGSRTVDHKTLEVIGDNSGLVEFSSGDLDFTNGFAIYRFGTPLKPDLFKIEAGLIERLTTNQPAELEKAKIVHTVQRIEEPEILLYFKNNKIGEVDSLGYKLKEIADSGRTELGYEEAAKLTGKSVKALKSAATKGALERTETGISVDSLRSYVLEPKSPRRSSAEVNSRIPNQNAEEAKQVAYARLEELQATGKVEMDSNDLRYILSSNDTSIATRLAKQEDIAPYLRREGNNRTSKMYLPADKVRSFLDARTYKGGKWVKK